MGVSYNLWGSIFKITVYRKCYFRLLSMVYSFTKGFLTFFPYLQASLKSVYSRHKAFCLKCGWYTDISSIVSNISGFLKFLNFTENTKWLGREKKSVNYWQAYYTLVLIENLPGSLKLSLLTSVTVNVIPS